MTTAMTVEEIQQSDSIPASIKRKLDSLEEQDLKPVALTKWAREIFSDGRRLGRDDLEITEWVKAYAKARYYSDAQISNVVRANEVERYEPRGGKGGSGSRGQISNWLPTFKDMSLEFTGANETEIIQADYSPKQAVKLAKNNIVDWISATEEAELRANLRWINIMRGLLDTTAEMIEEKLKSRTRFGRIER